MRNLLIMVLLCLLMIGCKNVPAPKSEPGIKPSDVPTIPDGGQNPSITQPPPPTVDPNNPNNERLFLEAVKNSNLSEAKLYLSRSRDVINAKDGNGKTALIYAVENGDRPMASLFLDEYRAFVNPNTADNRGMTALLYSVQKNDIALTEILLREEYGVNVNYQTTGQRNTALHYAAETGNAGIVKLLLENKMTLTNLTDVNGETAFMFAVKKGNRQMIKLFCESPRFDVTQRNRDGVPPLLLAIDNSMDIRLIEDIIDFCPNAMDSTDSRGRGPFEYLTLSKYSARDKQELDDILTSAKNRRSR